MLSVQDKHAIRKQLNTITGQAKAIQKMLKDGRNIYDMYIQFKAIEGLVNKAVYIVLDEVLRKRLAENLVSEKDHCPGECDYCDSLDLLMQKFSKMKIKEVLTVLTKTNIRD